MSDHDRPLNDRGRKAAPRAGAHLLERDAVPDRVLSSTAERARSTAVAICEASGYEGEIAEIRELYLASPAAIAAVVREHGGDADRVMVVAHNPGCEEFVERAAGVVERMSTANVARFAVPIDDWADLELDGSAELVELWRPRD